MPRYTSVGGVVSDLEPREIPFQKEPADFMLVGSLGKEEMEIYLHFDVFKALADLALADTSREQSGVLVGTVNKGTDGLYLRIDAYLPGLETEAPPGAALKAETLSKLKGSVDGLGREKRVLGWYHTHPNMHLSLSPEDEKLARDYFHFPWQVTYILDPINSDRNFFSWKDGALTARAGFRVYGKKDVIKEQQKMEERNPPRPEDPMRDRFFERHFEQLQQLIKEPPLQRHHQVMIAMLGLILLLQVFILMRGPAVSPGPGNGEMQKRLDKIQARLELLSTKGLPAPATPEPEPAPPATAAPAPATSAPVSPEASAPPSPAPAETTASPAATATPASAVRVHKVQKGETLSIICKKYYGTHDPGVIKWLSHVNNLQKPEKLTLGHELRIPPLPAYKKK